MLRFRRTVTTLLLGALAACEHSPTFRDPSFRILDGAHNDGNEHFYFLPPLVPNPGTSGAPDLTLRPEVQVCEWTASGCGALIARFGMETGTGSEVIRVDAAAGQYLVNWHTDRCVGGPCALDPSKTYRLRVLVGAIELGYADVDVVAGGSQLKNVQTSEFIGLVNGRTLPVKFRIEHGAVAVIPVGGSATVGTGGGQVTTADGRVGLTIPEGARASSTSITVSTVAAPPAGTGTWSPVIDLGPDGTAFAQPVILSVAYDPQLLPAGVPETALGLFTFDGTGWIAVAGSAVNAADNLVSAPISHFSYYWVGIVPNDILGQPTPTTLTSGQTTNVSAHLVYCTGTTSCEPYHALVNHAVQWSFDGAAITMTPSWTYTNSEGLSESPLITAVTPGYGEVSASAGVDGSIVETMVPINVLHSLQLVLDNSPMTTRHLGVGQWVVLDLTANPPAEDVIVTVNQSGPGVVQANPLHLFAGNASAHNVVIGRTVGLDTLIATAPGYGPDTVVIHVGLGHLRFGGWPSSLALGDSVRLTPEIYDPTNTLPATSEHIFLTLAPSPNLRFSNGQNAITFLPISGGFPPQTLYVTAIGTGTGTAQVTAAGYETFDQSIAIIGTPPSIGVSPNAIGFNSVPQGSSSQATFTITNGGGGTLSGLVLAPFRDFHTGTPYPWITATLSSTTAPATVTITAAPPLGQPIQNYRVQLGITAPGASNSEFLFHSIFVNVTAAPNIAPVPDVVGLNVALGSSAQATFALNPGGGALSGLALGPFTDFHIGEPYPWITATLSSTTTPATVTITASPPVGIPVQNYRVQLPITADNAGNSPFLFHSIFINVTPPPFSGYAAIDAGDEHTCALDSDGKPFCWGANHVRQLGIGTTDNLSHPTPLAVSGSLRLATLSIGAGTNCGLDFSNAAWCWGWGSDGQLGDGIGLGTTVPIAVAGGHTFATLTSGQNSTCAITTSAALYCWGLLFGNNPWPIPGGHSFAAVSAGNQFACALTTTGATWCFGVNDQGQRGTATPAPNLTTPVAVGGVPPFTAIASGNAHTCALSAAGDAYCWGRGTEGQLGDGAFTNYPTPVRISGTLFQSISAAGHSTCGITTAGVAVCWGVNDRGQVGDGTTTNRGTPRPVNAPAPLTSVHAGILGGCGLTAAREAWCWGAGNRGRLGNGLTSNSPTPVRVLEP